jgi:hypothetical protein
MLLFFFLFHCSYSVVFTNIILHCDTYSLAFLLDNYESVQHIMIPCLNPQLTNNSTTRTTNVHWTLHNSQLLDSLLQVLCLLVFFFVFFVVVFLSLSTCCLKWKDQLAGWSDAAASWVHQHVLDVVHSTAVCGVCR